MSGWLLARNAGFGFGVYGFRYRASVGPSTFFFTGRLGRLQLEAFITLSKSNIGACATYVIVSLYKD